MALLRSFRFDAGISSSSKKSFESFRLSAAPIPLGVGEFRSEGGVKLTSGTLSCAERESDGGTARDGSCGEDVFWQ